MEQECHALDVALIIDKDNGIEGGSSYGHYVEDYHKAEEIKKQIEE